MWFHYAIDTKTEIVMLIYILYFKKSFETQVLDLLVRLS